MGCCYSRECCCCRANLESIAEPIQAQHGRRRYHVHSIWCGSRKLVRCNPQCCRRTPQLSLVRSGLFDPGGLWDNAYRATTVRARRARVLVFFAHRLGFLCSQAATYLRDPGPNMRNDKDRAAYWIAFILERCQCASSPICERQNR